MTRKRNKAQITGNQSDPTEPEAKDSSRRDFLKGGIAIGAGATVLAPSVLANASEHGNEIEWDYEVDVVVCGAGAMGLSTAIRAHDEGASVLAIDQNFDPGGRMMHSASWVSLGGGDSVQRRDMAGEADEEGFINMKPLFEPEELDDNVELLFKDMTDWSIVDPAGQATYRYNERDLHRAWADNAPLTRDFLKDNYCRFALINGTHSGGGMSRARMASVMLMVGDRTDIKAGTITPEDAGVADPLRSSLFAPNKLRFAADRGNEDAVYGGACIARCLEFSAREKGVSFMLNRQLEKIYREGDNDGAVLGIRARYSPHHDPETGERIESYRSNGNIDERSETINIRARNGVVVATGGHASDPDMRGMYNPGMREPMFVTSGWALLGGDNGISGGADGSGIKAGMRVGAGLAGMMQNLGYHGTWGFKTRLGVRDAHTAQFPGHPSFNLRGAVGFDIGAAGLEHVVVVNQVGKRFYNEMTVAKRTADPKFPGGPKLGTPKAGMAHVPLDWRNCSRDWVKENYNHYSGVDAALAINEGSAAPDYLCGPSWAIFDQEALERAGWDISYPHTADNGYFFQADTLEELAQKIYAGNEYQRMPVRHLVDTIERWNISVDSGTDEEFDRGEAEAPMHRIGTPPFYAGSMLCTWHDSYGGLRINGNCQVVDLDGGVIPGLYAGAEASGGGQQHGLGRATVHGYIAGAHVARGVVRRKS